MRRMALILLAVTALALGLAIAARHSLIAEFELITSPHWLSRTRRTECSAVR